MAKARIDGMDVFGTEVRFALDSPVRESVERSMPGLDGVLSIDLGQRGRRIEQKGVLRAVSEALLRAQIDSLEALHDGASHELVSDWGETFENVRIENVKCGAIRASGGSVSCTYEIVYRQLAV